MPLLNCGEISHSTSPVGYEVRQILAGSALHFRSSWTYGTSWQTVMARLTDLYQECSQADWDGYGASPLSPEVFHGAAQFAASIPFDIPVPEISASPQGDISFEWAQSPRRIVSVAVSENGEVHYAALNGHKRAFGSFPFDGSFDSQLRDLIQVVLG